MTSEEQIQDGAPQDVFVWIWLPGATEPVVAGRGGVADTRIKYAKLKDAGRARANVFHF